MPYHWRSKHPAQRDGNEPAIMRELLDRGALVIQLDHPVDLLIGYLGEWTLAEIKASPKAPFRLSQIRFLDQCEIRGLRAVAMDHIDDVDTYFPIPPEGV